MKPRGKALLKPRAVVLAAALLACAALAVQGDFTARMSDALTAELAASPGTLFLLFAGYALVLAIPFVPAAEFGLMVLALFGAQAAIPVYVATVCGLCLAFAVGRLAPAGWLDAQRHPGPENSAPAFASGRRWLLLLIRHRALALIVLINLPGNSVLGGGGGLSLAAGMSRLFSFPAFVLCAAVAVAPVPLAVLVLAELGAGEAITGWLGNLADKPAAEAADLQ